MATATLQYRVDGGAVHTDSTVVTGGEVISFLAASYAGWNAPAVTWEIVAYPPGWPVPSGWSENTSSGHYYYRANSGASGITPPTITIPDPGDYWGKWHFRLTVNGTIISSVIGVESVSPTLGLHDLAVREGAQWDAKRRWVGNQQDNARVLDASAFVGGGYVASLSATTPLAASAATGPVALTWAPTADVAMSSHKITGLTDPSSAQDAATKAYVDAVAAGLDPKQSVFVATTGSITLSGTQTIDSVSVTAGKRVLVKDQGDATTGIYLCAAGAWTRTTDLAAAASAAGVYCFVERGTVNGDKGFVCTNNVGSDVVGTDTLAFTQFTASGLDANAHVLEDATTALGVNGVPMRAAPSTVGFVGVACAPISLTHKTAAAAGVAEGLRLIQQINAGGVGNPGTGSEAIKLAFALPNGLGAETLATSIRGEWTTVIGGGTSRLVLATALAGTETDRATLGGTGLWRWHAYGVGRILSDASGNLTSAAITFTEVQTALAAASGSIAVNSQKITGLVAGASSGEAVEYSQLGTSVNAAVSGTTNALAQFTAAHVIGDSGVTDDGTTVNTTRTVTFTGDSVGSTQTRGVTLVNNTVSGTQYTRQHGFTAFHSGGTQWNIGSRLEVVNASHARQIWYYGSGSAVPSSEILRLDTQDDNFGALVRGPVFAASATGGYRFDFDNNRGGLKYNSGSDYIYLESYNTKDLRFYTGANSGGSGGVLRMIWNGTGQGYAQFVPTTPTSSSNVMTINLTTSQNVEHTLTENTTVTITGGVNGQRGTIVFSQPASAKTVTMPTNGSGVEYDNTLTALGGGTYQPAIVDTTNLTRTVLNYYVLANGKAFIYSRSVALIP